MNSFVRIKSVACLIVLVLSMLYHVVPHSHHDANAGLSNIRMSFGPTHSMTSATDDNTDNCHKGSLLHFFLFCHGDDDCDSNEFLELEVAEIFSSKLQIPSAIAITPISPHLLTDGDTDEALDHEDSFDFSLDDEWGRFCTSLRGPPIQHSALI